VIAPPSDTDPTASVVLEIALDDYPAQFHVEEIIRAVAAVSNVIRDLVRDGLLHRSGDFVFATRAAVRSAELRI
jgi:hypothetical protein